MTCEGIFHYALKYPNYGAPMRPKSKRISPFQRPRNEDLEFRIERQFDRVYALIPYSQNIFISPLCKVFHQMTVR